MERRRAFRWIALVALHLVWTPTAVVIISRGLALGLASDAMVAIHAVALVVVAASLELVAARFRSVRYALHAGAFSCLIAAAVFAPLLSVFDERVYAALPWLIFVAAVCEELVFRRIIPRGLGDGLRQAGMRAAPARFIGGLVAQLTFVLSHAVLAPLPPYELGRLVVAGLLFSELASGPGVWSAMVAHAALNYFLAAGYPVAQPVAPIFLGGAACLGVVLLAMRAHEGAVPSCRVRRREGESVQ